MARCISPTSTFPAGAFLRFSELMTFPKVYALCRGHMGDLQRAAARANGVTVSSGLNRLGRSTDWTAPPPGFYDARTLYVEGFPETFEFDNLIELFSHWGEIVRLSLPRQGPGPSTHKGFCFIEYARVEEAELVATTSKFFAKEGNFTPGIALSTPFNLSCLKVLTKEVWSSFKVAFKETESKESRGASTEDTERGKILRLEGIPHTLPFHTLSAACNAPARACYIDAPSIFSNGIMPRTIVRSGSGKGWLERCQVAVSSAASIAQSKSSHLPPTPIFPWLDGCTKEAVDFDDSFALATAPTLQAATVRYSSSAHASAALAHFSGTGQGGSGLPMLLGGQQIQGRILTGSEEDSYLEQVAREKAAYAASKEGSVKRRLSGRDDATTSGENLISRKRFKREGEN